MSLSVVGEFGDDNCDQPGFFPHRAIKGDKRDGSSSGRSVARPKKADSVR